MCTMKNIVSNVEINADVYYKHEVAKVLILKPRCLGLGGVSLDQGPRSSMEMADTCSKRIKTDL